MLYFFLTTLDHKLADLCKVLIGHNWLHCRIRKHDTVPEMSLANLKDFFLKPHMLPLSLFSSSHHSASEGLFWCTQIFPDKFCILASAPGDQLLTSIEFSKANGQHSLIHISTFFTWSFIKPWSPLAFSADLCYFIPHSAHLICTCSLMHHVMQNDLASSSAGLLQYLRMVLLNCSEMPQHLRTTETEREPQSKCANPNANIQVLKCALLWLWSLRWFVKEKTNMSDYRCTACPLYWWRLQWWSET